MIFKKKKITNYNVKYSPQPGFFSKKFMSLWCVNEICSFVFCLKVHRSVAKLYVNPL